MRRADELKRIYHLQAHPEGGAFSESYASPRRDGTGRELSGSIYFLLEGAEVSHFHRIDCDELWYFHEGCGMRVTMIDPEGRVSRVELGLGEGQRAMAVIPEGVVFAAENLDAAGYTFVSCATAPRFRYEGFTLIGRESLRRLCPDADQALLRLAYPGEDRGV